MAVTFMDEGKLDVVDKLDISVSSTRDFKYIGWGTGAGTANDSTRTTLFTEKTDETRATGTVSQQTTTIAGDTYRVVGVMTCAGSGATITNAGLFDNTDRTDATDRILIHGDHTGVALLVGDQISYTFNLAVA